MRSSTAGGLGIRGARGVSCRAAVDATVAAPFLISMTDQHHDIDGQQARQQHGPERQSGRAANAYGASINPGIDLPLPFDFRFLQCIENEGHGFS